MDLLHKILWFLISIGILVFIHEMGHYLVGRFFNVKVLRFSIGFGRPLYSWKVGSDRTIWSISSIPLGGFVDFLHMRQPANDGKHCDRAFYRKSYVEKCLIVLAGPAANFFLAIFLYFGLFYSGIPGIKPILSNPPIESIASQSGLVEGDLIISVGDEKVNSWQEARWKILEQMHSANLNLRVKRNTSQPADIFLNLDDIDLSKSNVNYLELIGIIPKKLEIPAIVGKTVENGSAQRSGILVGDEILAVGEVEIINWNHLVEVVKFAPNTEKVIQVRRKDEVIDLIVRVEGIEVENKIVGRLGVQVDVPQKSLDEISVSTKYPVIMAFSEAIKKTWDISVFTLKMIGRMISGQVSISNLSGPVTIADYAGKTAEYGLQSFIGFLALISISLGVVNLLPIPILDGGWLVYLSIEAVKGSALNERSFMLLQSLGMGLLGTIFIFAIYNDLVRLYAQ